MQRMETRSSIRTFSSPGALRFRSVPELKIERELRVRRSQAGRTPEAMPMGRGSALPDHNPLRPERPGARVRVLVVDDYPGTAESMALLLRLDSYDADVALDGQAALEQARAKPPDVVLLDLSMPGLSGYEVARQQARCGNECPCGG